MSNRIGTGGGVSPRVLNVVIGVVVTAWVVSLVLDATNVWADPSETIGLAFMAILGPLVGVWAARMAASQSPAPDRRPTEDAQPEGDDRE